MRLSLKCGNNVSNGTFSPSHMSSASTKDQRILVHIGLFNAVETIVNSWLSASDIVAVIQPFVTAVRR